MITRLVSRAAVLATATATAAAMVAVFLPAAAAAAPPDGGLALELRSAEPTYRPGEPVRLSFAVTNTWNEACGLTDVAVGTVQVVSVRRDGVELAPALGRSFFEDGIDAEIASGMVAVEPGAAVDVELASGRLAEGGGPDSAVLRSVTATASGAGLDALWPVGAPGRYEVTAGYTVPGVDTDVAPCAGSAAAGTVGFTVGAAGDDPGPPGWLWALLGVLLALAVAGFIVVLLVRRRHTSAAAALMLVGVAAAVAVGGEPAQADFQVDPDSGIPVEDVDFRAAVNGCFEKFDAPGGDPAGVMERLRDPDTPRVRIIPTDGGSGAFETPRSPDGEGSSTVTWNPTARDPYGDGVARDPCAALYHELVHADDIARDAVPEGMCGNTGIPTSEVRATLAENEYRRSQDLPPRTEYNGHQLPASIDECDDEPTTSPERSDGPERLCEDSADCGRTSGDPHLVTFDRTYYDFQAVGEFVVVRSTSGEALEVQARQSAYPSSRTVAINTALAFRIGEHTASIALVDSVSRVHVDGEPVVLPPGETPVPGGGRIVRRDSDTGAADGYDIHWPDGSAAAVDQAGPYGYRLLVRLDPSRAGEVEGLLGDFDGDPSNDLTPRSGTPLALPASFEELYPSYADSWRIAKEASLFSYAGGEDTETFTDRTYPDRHLTVDDLDDADRARAASVCRWAGVTEPWLLNECVFDVAVTGRPEFAVSTAGTELVATPVAAPIAATPIAAAALESGGEDRLTFAGRAGDAVFVDVVAPTLPPRCSSIRLLDPSGAAVGSGCTSNGAGIIDRTTLAADGDYTVLIEGHEGDGKAMVRVYASQDIEGTIEPNGAAVTAVLEQPGSVARYRFTGSAGQRVYVEAGSTLPAQCSTLRLFNEDGMSLASGCVVNGTGIVEGTVLPADGTYEVVVDPRGRTIGTVRMRLFGNVDQVGSITVDGPPVVATIDAPGSVVRYEFTAAAGTSITVAATDATLPSQCSPLRLFDEDGGQVASGCVINGEGEIRSTVLPENGVYAIVVDPNRSATGSLTLSLRTT